MTIYTRSGGGQSLYHRPPLWRERTGHACTRSRIRAVRYGRVESHALFPAALGGAQQ